MRTRKDACVSNQLPLRKQEIGLTKMGST